MFQQLKQLFGKKLSTANVDVNHPAPDFSLPDEKKNIVKLSDFRNKRDVLLFFIRGDFCPFCQMMLRTYQKEQEKFKKRNVMMISIGPGPVSVNHQIVEKFGLDYKVLCDEKQRIIKEYGLNDAEDKRMYQEGMPIPASFLIDHKGIVRYRTRANKTEEIFNPSDIFEVLELLPEKN